MPAWGGLLLAAIGLSLASCGGPGGCHDPQLEGREEPSRLDTSGGSSGSSGLDGSADAAASEDGSGEDLPPRGDGGSPSSTLTVAVISDLNGAYGSTEYRAPVKGAVDRIVGLSPDLVLCTGDMVAGQQAGLDYRAMWAAFHGAVTERLASAGIPLAVSPGNHDASRGDRYREEREVFISEWGARRPAVDWVEDADYPVRYAFARGPALFVSLDASSVGPLGPEQMRWLEARLRDGRDLPVKLVFGHLPIRPLTQGREREVMGDRRLERLLAEHGVAAYVSGHHHAFYPGRRGALRLIGVGCLGAGPRALLGVEEVAPQSFVVLEVTPTGVSSVRAYAGDRFDRLIRRAELPARLGEGGSLVVRDDL